MEKDQPSNEILRLHKHIEELEALIACQQTKQELLTENEKNLSAFFNTMEQMLFVLDMQGNILLTNDTTIQKLGYSREELSGKNVLELHPPERRTEATQILEEMLLGKVKYCPVPVMARNGVQIPVETRVSPGKWSGRDVLFGVTKDISAIKISEEKFSKAFHASPAFMAISDVETGVYFDVNETFLKTLGYTRNEVIGKSSLDLNIIVHPEQRESLIGVLNLKGGVHNFEGDIRTKQGEIRKGLFSIEFMQLQDRRVLLSVMSDITVRKSIEEALRQSEERLNLFFSQSLDGFFFMMLDEPIHWDDTVDKERALDYVFAHQRITKVNDAMMAQYKSSRDQFLGMTPNDLFAHDIEQGRQVWRKFLDEGHLHIDTDERKFDGTQMWVEGDYVCMYDLQGRITGHFGIQRDVTERKQMEMALATERRRLSDILKGTNVGTWEWNVQTGEVILNERWAEMVGYTLEELSPLSLETWVKLTHSEDIKRSKDLLKKHFRGQRDYYELEVRMRHKNGHWVWALDRGKVATWTEDGKPLLMSGTHQDVTEHKLSEDAVRESEMRFRTLFNQNHDAVFLLDFEGRHIMANQRAADMLGYTNEEMAKLSVVDTSAEQEKSLAIVKRLLAGEPIPLFERLFRKKDGQTIQVEINIELIRDKNGNPIHIQSVVRDISERKRAERDIQIANEQLRAHVLEIEQLQTELREQALHDPLTGLYNRRHLEDTLQREISRAKREKKHLSVIVLDIDHFKKVNDKHGHAIGDKFLIEIANITKKYARLSDIVCRYGGEEFLMVLPGATLKSALKRAEEIKQRCADAHITHNDLELKITMSIGVATYPEHGKEAEEIIIKADKAMYKSKRSGRNQVTAWEENTK